MAFEFLKKQFRKVIQWESDNVNDIIYKYPLERKEEIMRKSRLVVREGRKRCLYRRVNLRTYSSRVRMLWTISKTSRF